jgi:predicted N-acetyltransferase YhbS
MGHEFWIGYEGEVIVGIAVLGRVSSVEVKIIYLQVADAYRGRGVGSSLLRAVIEENPGCDFTVVPFHGTEGFYRKLRFEQSGKLEMKLRATAIKPN